MSASDGADPTRFERTDLSGASFERVDLSESRFRFFDLSHARFQTGIMSGVVFRGVEMADVEIDGELSNVVINGVDVGPLIEAELDRRDPNRVRMRPTDADGFREAWDLMEGLWEGTVTRARGLDPDLLHESVDGEWSFIQTLRHLVFATDAWITRAVLGHPDPWHPLDLPHDTFQPLPVVPNDPGARPSLDEVLALREDRMATVRGVIQELTDERLDAQTEPVTEPGYPESQSFRVRDCLNTILSEEWSHRLFAERDLDVLASREGSRR